MSDKLLNFNTMISTQQASILSTDLQVKLIAVWRVQLGQCLEMHRLQRHSQLGIN